MNNEIDSETEIDDLKDEEIKSNKVMAFKQWLFLTIFLFAYYALTLIPYEYLSDYLDIGILPDKYWFNAIPTFFFVTAACIFIYAKALELIKTVDNPPYKDFYYKELDYNQMIKEIKYDYKEGILPDAGDINQKIVEEVIAMNKKKKD